LRERKEQRLSEDEELVLAADSLVRVLEDWGQPPLNVATGALSGRVFDSMVHLIFGVRRAQKDGKKGWDAWIAARQEQWRGIVYSDVIIAAGFGIFALSNFPPTQRFGLVVFSATIIGLLPICLCFRSWAALSENGRSPTFRLRLRLRTNRR
jgi:hypothetical protein